MNRSIFNIKLSDALPNRKKIEKLLKLYCPNDRAHLEDGERITSIYEYAGRGHNHLIERFQKSNPIQIPKEDLSKEITLHPGEAKPNREQLNLIMQKLQLLIGHLVTEKELELIETLVLHLYETIPGQFPSKNDFIKALESKKWKNPEFIPSVKRYNLTDCELPFPEELAKNKHYLQKIFNQLEQAFAKLSQGKVMFDKYDIQLLLHSVYRPQLLTIFRDAKNKGYNVYYKNYINSFGAQRNVIIISATNLDNFEKDANDFLNEL